MIIHPDAKKVAKETFIGLEEKYNKIHNNKYDYSNVIYKTRREKIKIICPIHGEFSQEPINHLNGKGCKKCGQLITQKSRKHTEEEFIIEANKLHNNYYNYSNLNFIDYSNNVDIICPKHGIFKQKPIKHLSGQKCPICSAPNKALTKEKFILEANKIHGNYDYSKIIFKNASTKVDIICKKHGIFSQQPSKHLTGQGCPICSKDKTTYEIYKGNKTILYYVTINGIYKIGIRKYDNRYKDLESNILKKRFGHDIKYNNIKVNIIKTKIYDDGWKAYLKEQEILTKYDKYRYMYGHKDMDWFVGYTELFSKDIFNL